MPVPAWRRPPAERSSNVWDGPFFTSAAPPKTREDFVELTPSAWDDMSSGSLPVGVTRYERPGKTDLIMWKNKDGFTDHYVEVRADIAFYKKKVPDEFGVDADKVAMIAAFAARQWNDDMWFYVHDKGFSPTAAAREVAIQDGEFLKAVISWTMAVLGSGPSVVKTGGVGPRPDRVAPTSRRGDPTHVYNEVGGISSGIKHAGGQVRDWMVARDEATFDGKYSQLKHSFYYPQDADKWGSTKKEWEQRYAATKYGGGRFNVPSGYWVWIFPFYFIWDKRKP